MTNIEAQQVYPRPRSTADTMAAAPLKASRHRGGRRRSGSRRCIIRAGRERLRFTEASFAGRYQEIYAFVARHHDDPAGWISTVFSDLLVKLVDEEPVQNPRWVPAGRSRLATVRYEHGRYTVSRYVYNGNFWSWRGEGAYPDAAVAVARASRFNYWVLCCTPGENSHDNFRAAYIDGVRVAYSRGWQGLALPMVA